MTNSVPTMAFMCSGFQFGLTALMYAAANGKCDVVTELISLGADVDIQTNVSHFLCLIMIRDLQICKSSQFGVKSLCIHLSPELLV